MGRPPIGKHAMTNAERQAAWRARHRATTAQASADSEAAQRRIAELERENATLRERLRAQAAPSVPKAPKSGRFIDPKDDRLFKAGLHPDRTLSDKRQQEAFVRYDEVFGTYVLLPEEAKERERQAAFREELREGMRRRDAHLAAQAMSRREKAAARRKAKRAQT